MNSARHRQSTESESWPVDLVVPPRKSSHFLVTSVSSNRFEVRLDALADTAGSKLKNMVVI